ncbi:MAG: sodium/panthothenate symporter, partial [Fusobacterium mortiferum]|nr:sodium/panthothenate symporter [Fusobacterium mortiferum]
ATFFCPIVFGLFWKKANSTGAIASMIFGFITFIYLTVCKISILGMHTIVPVLFVSSLVFIIGSYAGEPNDEKIIDIFFNF